MYILLVLITHVYHNAQFKKRIFSLFNVTISDAVSYFGYIVSAKDD